MIRYSCWLTLKKKFKLKNIYEVLSIYTKDVVVGLKKKYRSQLITCQDIIKKPIAYKIDKNLTVPCVKEYFNRAAIFV